MEDGESLVSTSVKQRGSKLTSNAFSTEKFQIIFYLQPKKTPNWAHRGIEPDGNTSSFLHCSIERGDISDLFNVRTQCGYALYPTNRQRKHEEYNEKTRKRAHKNAEHINLCSLVKEHDATIITTQHSDQRTEESTRKWHVKSNNNNTQCVQSEWDKEKKSSHYQYERNHVAVIEGERETKMKRK